VALGGFGSVPGALAAGLMVGVIQSLSAYLLGPVYKDIIVYGRFVLILWVRPEGLFGKAGA
jgi:branched-chain amino acid transport system permease protein